MLKKVTSLTRDLGIIGLSVIVAVIIGKTGILVNVLTGMREMQIIGSFIAGMFFVSVFTVAPAAVVLVEIAQANSLLTVAFFGALGALIGDLLIFRFIRDSLSKSLLDFFIRPRQNKIMALSRMKIFRLLSPLIGALIIASPLPDEIGLMIMGLSKIRTLYFVPLAFSLNFLGILIIGLVAK